MLKRLKKNYKARQDVCKDCIHTAQFGNEDKSKLKLPPCLEAYQTRQATKAPPVAFLAVGRSRQSMSGNLLLD